MIYHVKSRVLNTRKSMAGWTMMADDGTILYSSETLRKAQKNEVCFEGKPIISKGTKFDEIRCLFDRFISVFLKEICGVSCFRPLPAMLGDGQPVDLMKLFLVVKERGGYDSVSRNGMWDLVAEESGFSSMYASLVKLIYVKYLDVLERWLDRGLREKKLGRGFVDGDADSDAFLMQLEVELSSFLSGISDQAKKSERCPTLDSVHVEKLCNDEKVDDLQGDSESGINGSNAGSCSGEISSGMMKMKYSTKCTRQVDSEDAKILKDDVEMTDVDESGEVNNCFDDDEEVTCRKRKRESMWEMLSWVIETSKNPCDPGIGVIPERSKWGSYGNEEHWKRLLTVRDALLLKPDVDSSAGQTIWQIKQKMHLSMYDDGLSEKRCSGRLHSVNKKPQSKNTPGTPPSSTESDSNKKHSPCMEETSDHLRKDSMVNIFINARRQKRIPTGSSFQADIPEWTGTKSKSDSKWLGTQIWPLDKSEKRFMVERERTGKGGQDSCGCALQGSVECVHFHICEKRMRLKLELGSAFYHWNVHKMGEDVKLSWTSVDEDKFKSIVKSNVAASDKYFWNKMFKLFPTRSREALVRYYFNIFLLRLRSDQNRLTPNDIDSDDDESESGPVSNVFGREVTNSPNSILFSPNKAHRNPR